MPFESLTDAHTPGSAELFLDTSIHCCRLKGSLFCQRVEKVLGLFRWIGTSSYSKVEYGNAVLAQAEYYLRKLEEFGSLEATLDFIGNVLPISLHSGKVVWSFNLLRTQYGANDAECAERARLSLRRLMKLGTAFVEELCDRPIENGTDCYWARLDVYRRKDGRLVWRSPQCRRSHKRCRLDEFFIANLHLFRKMKETIDTLPDDQTTQQLQGFSDVIGRAIDDAGVLLDYSTGCKRLADAIIAADSREFRSMFSQNVRESGVLTKVLAEHSQVFGRSSGEM